MVFVLLRYDLFFFKQKTAYEMRISDWSSDVCSSDLLREKVPEGRMRAFFEKPHPHPNPSPAAQERGSSKQEQAYVHPQPPAPARPGLRTHPSPDALPAVLRDVPQRHPQHLDGGGGRLLARHQRPEDQVRPGRAAPDRAPDRVLRHRRLVRDRKSTRLNSSH